jgi:hypothetical protein
MKRLVLGVAIAAALIGGSRTASAQVTWCAAEQGQRSQTCAFYTFEQCRVFVIGAGGYCVPNPYLGHYPPELRGHSPDPQERRRPRRRYYER